MRFAYVAVGAAGFLTSTMIDGRVIPASEAMSRSTSFQSRSIDPYTSQQAPGNTPYATQETSSPSTGRATSTSDSSNTSSTPSAVENQSYATSDKQGQAPVPAEQSSAANPATSSSYAEGQNVGSRAGHKSDNPADDNLQPSAPTNFPTQDGQLNQADQAGPQTGVIQHSSHNYGPNGTHDGKFMKGQPDDSQAAHPPHMQGGKDLEEKAIPPTLEGNQHFNKASKAGSEVGVNQSTNARESVNGQNGSQGYNGVQAGIGESVAKNAQVGSGQAGVQSTNISGGAKDEVLSPSQVDDRKDTY